MTERKQHYKRKTYLIQKMFQTKFIILFLLLVIIGSLISGLILYFRANMQLGHSYGMAHVKLTETGEILKPALFISFGISIVLIGIATILLTIYISHKIAGPLYRFEKSSEEIGNGDLTLVTKVRESDQIKGLADAFSRMTMNLREKLLEIDSGVKDLSSIVEDFNMMAQQEKPDLEAIKRKFCTLEQKTEELRRSLQYFKL